MNMSEHSSFEYDHLEAFDENQPVGTGDDESADPSAFT
jgi:hypothetical protein